MELENGIDQNTVIHNQRRQKNKAINQKKRTIINNTTHDKI